MQDKNVTRFFKLIQLVLKRAADGFIKARMFIFCDGKNWCITDGKILISIACELAMKKGFYVLQKDKSLLRCYVGIGNDEYPNFKKVIPVFKETDNVFYHKFNTYLRDYELELEIFRLNKAIYENWRVKKSINANNEYRGILPMKVLQLLYSTGIWNVSICRYQGILFEQDALKVKILIMPFREEVPAIDLPAGWMAFETAPKTCKCISVICKDGSIHRVHYAKDLTGEDQPPFEGWFKDNGNCFAEVTNIIGWKR